MRLYVDPYDERVAIGQINGLANKIHHWAEGKGFYDFSPSDPRMHDILGMKLALIHSEVSECLEVIRLLSYDDLMKGELGNLSEELADIIIRVLDLTEYCSIDIGKAIVDKMEVNFQRLYKHGKHA